MARQENVDPIRTPRLELVLISAEFARVLVEGDRSRASAMIGATVGRWFAADPTHAVQLAIAQAADAGVPLGGGRVVVLIERTGGRRAIGSVGFHGPPDDRGRLEAGCRIHPAHRGRGYAGEAMTAMFDWAAAHLGIRRFLVLVAAAGADGLQLVAELELTGRGPLQDRISELEAVIDASP